HCLVVAERTISEAETRQESQFRHTAQALRQPSLFSRQHGSAGRAVGVRRRAGVEGFQEARRQQVLFASRIDHLARTRHAWIEVADVARSVGIGRMIFVAQSVFERQLLTGAETVLPEKVVMRGAAVVVLLDDRKGCAGRYAQQEIGEIRTRKGPVKTGIAV